MIQLGNNSITSSDSLDGLPERDDECYTIRELDYKLDVNSVSDEHGQCMAASIDLLVSPE